MPVVTKDEAVAILTQEVEHNFDLFDLLDVYNELFPEAQLTEQAVGADRARLVGPIVDFLRTDRAVEDLVDVWRLVVPKHRNVWYNEEEDRIHYNEEAEPLPAE